MHSPHLDVPGTKNDGQMTSLKKNALLDEDKTPENHVRRGQSGDQKGGHFDVRNGDAEDFPQAQAKRSETRSYVLVTLPDTAEHVS